MEQLLESIAMGDIVCVEEGLFAANVPDADYKEFSKIVNQVWADVCPPKDDKNYEKVDGTIKKKLSKKANLVAIRVIEGRWNGFKLLHTSKAAKEHYTAYGNVPSVEKFISKVRQKYKMVGNLTWTVAYTNSVETSRSITFQCKCGEESLCIMTIACFNYKLKYDEYYIVDLRIRPIRSSDTKKLDNGKWH